jgi:hypothetical protein
MTGPAALGSALSAGAEMIIPVHSRPFSRDFCQKREQDDSKERKRERSHGGRERERSQGLEAKPAVTSKKGSGGQLTRPVRMEIRPPIEWPNTKRGRVLICGSLEMTLSTNSAIAQN